MCARSNKKAVGFIDSESNSKKIDYASLQEVENLCQLLLAFTQNYEKRCLTFVLDEKRKLWLSETVHHGHHVQLDKNCISLENLLNQSASSLNQSGKLDKCSCLALAVNLASSLLQLHSTPWLSETWSNKSVLFPVHIEQPYVLTKFGESATTQIIQDDVLNPYLVELGIILLEMWVGVSFLDWITSNNVKVQFEDVKDRAAVATKWLLTREVIRNMVQDYAQIVQLCLNCSFIPIQPIRNLTEDSFREVVYRDIVHRLEMVYSTYTKSLKLNC